MKKQLILLTFILLTSFAYCQEITVEQDTLTTTYYFIRHAEKNRTDANNKNPNLNMDGVLRAAKWSLVFDSIKFDAIYSTDYYRTKQTAQPTAEKNNLEITLYDPNGLDVKTLLQETKGKTVLIVGHSNTTPMLVNAVIGSNKYQQIKDDQNGNLYIVSISKSGDINDTLLRIN